MERLENTDVLQVLIVANIVAELFKFTKLN
jgi:hypothetical protein